MWSAVREDNSDARSAHLRRLLVGAVVAAVALISSLAWAQAAGFRYKVKSSVAKGKSKPAVILRATGDVKSSKIHFERSDGKEFTKNIGAMSSGEKKTIPVDQPEGTYSYEITITGKGAEGEEIDTSFDAEMSVVGELKVWVKKNQNAVANGHLSMKANRAIDKVFLEVRNDTGRTVHDDEIELGGVEGKFTIEWPEVEDVSAIKLKVYDTHGFW